MTHHGMLAASLLACVACGGGGDEGTPPEGGGGGGGTEGGEEQGGDIAVEIDEPEEGQMVVLDEQGRIGFVTNVRLEMETRPGTPGEAVQQFGRAVQARMTEIRGCYDRAVASDPEVEGSLRLVLATDARGRPSSQVARAEFSGGRITQCVTRKLAAIPPAELPHGATIELILIASNTMAAGTREVREHRERQEEPRAP